MKKLLGILVLGLLFSGNAYAENCPDNMKLEGFNDETIKSYAEFFDNYYVPEEAYDFGIKIQNLLKAKDLAGLFELFEDDYFSVPEKSFIKDKSFDEIFSEEWVTSILSDTPSCSPVGWRGFMLDNGKIWYNKEKNGWTIFGTTMVTFKN